MKVYRQILFIITIVGSILTKHQTTTFLQLTISSSHTLGLTFTDSAKESQFVQRRLICLSIGKSIKKKRSTVWKQNARRARE